MKAAFADRWVLTSATLSHRQLSLPDADRWVLTSATLSHRQLPSPNPERSRRVADYRSAGYSDSYSFRQFAIAL